MLVSAGRVHLYTALNLPSIGRDWLPARQLTLAEVALPLLS